MGPLGVIFVAVLAALAGERAVGAIVRSRARWVRYLRGCPPSRLSDLPSRMITAGQRRRGRARVRAEPLARLGHPIPTPPEGVTLTETGPRERAETPRPMAPAVESVDVSPESASRSKLPAEAGSPAVASPPALPDSHHLEQPTAAEPQHLAQVVEPDARP